MNKKAQEKALKMLKDSTKYTLDWHASFGSQATSIAIQLKCWGYPHSDEEKFKEVEGLVEQFKRDLYKWIDDYNIDNGDES